MTPTDLIAKVRSGVLRISIENDNHEPLGSGTAFLVPGGIVTCSHVLPPNQQDFTVVIERDDAENGATKNQVRLLGKDVLARIKKSSHKDDDDYVFIECDGLDDFDGCHRFEFIKSGCLRVGQEVVFLGFPFGYNHLTSHIGYISAIYFYMTQKMIQIDGSVNKGNSGGPLLDIGSGKVVGLITRAESGFLEKAFNELRESFDRNIEFVKSHPIGIRVGNFDMQEAFNVTQNQLKQLALNIQRSANVGIGIAYSTDPLLKYLAEKAAK